MSDLRKAAEIALEALETLWDILDDIDTASDVAKENDGWYRKRVEALQKKRWDTAITTDGYKLKGGPVEALRQALSNEFNPDWNQVEALQESLREHMAEIQRLRQALAQPKREWVGLTVDEVFECWKTGDVVPAVEAKLKEKNT